MAYFQSVGLHVKKGKGNNLTNLKADKISSVYDTDSNKKMKRAKRKKQDAQLSQRDRAAGASYSFRQK